MRFAGGGLLIAAVLWDHVHAQSLPTVDLGYEVHQALSFSDSYQTYNFSNIRYAQSPTGNLRFSSPVAPTGRDSDVEDGSVGRVCPQARPNWSYTSQQFTTSIMKGTVAMFDYNQAVENTKDYLLAHPFVQDSRATEDCLFLDVVVPKAIFDDTGSVRNKTSRGAPVVVWIHGGGFTTGSKTAYNPQGLIKASQSDGKNGIIFVAMNYRLGALGWLAGHGFQDAGGVSNAGLFDQKLAIEWVTKYIDLFGGNPKDITLMGESAGGSSIMHHITAYGGQGVVSFQKAILQSPGFLPRNSPYQQELVTRSFLQYLNVTSIADARAASSDAVIAANLMQVENSFYGTYTFGPVVDGVYSTTLPGLAIQAGAFHKYVSIMLGHNSNEGAVFTPPYVDTNDQLSTFLTTIFPNIKPAVVDYITNTLYPYPSANTTGLPYATGVDRTILLISDVVFTCNTNYVARGFSYMTRNYEFAIPPGFHGQDLAYTFQTDRDTNLSQMFFRTIADALQGYLTNFAKSGDPNGPQVPWFPIQGMNASENALRPQGVSIESDPTVNPRCRWWQRALYT